MMYPNFMLNYSVTSLGPARASENSHGRKKCRELSLVRVLLALSNWLLRDDASIIHFQVKDKIENYVTSFQNPASKSGSFIFITLKRFFRTEADTISWYLVS